jgi:hypothetical protein
MIEVRPRRDGANHVAYRVAVIATAMEQVPVRLYAVKDVRSEHHGATSSQSPAIMSQ